MVLNTTAVQVGKPVSSLKLLETAGYSVVTSGRETFVSIRPVKDAELTSWGEIIHLRHHPGRKLTVFADTMEQALEVLAYEFHIWEIRESFRVAHHSRLRAETAAG